MYVSSDLKIRVTELTEISKEKTYRFNVCLSNELGFAEHVTLILQKYHSPQRKEIPLCYIGTKNNVSTFLTEDVQFEFGTGLYFYCFKLDINGKTSYIKLSDNNVILTNSDMPWMEFTVTTSLFRVPKWAKGAIMYQIMVDRFARDLSVPVFERKRRTIHENWDDIPDWKPNEQGQITNTDFFCGNFKGITNHLKYIKKLGVKIIYLTPVCESQSNHRYDTADYKNVDPYLGCIDDLKELCRKAHNLGMRVLLDGVFNHTGNDSVYFNSYSTYPEPGAYSGTQSKYYHWYKKEPGSIFAYWWGFHTLPECDPYNKEWQEFLFGKDGVIETMFSWGIDGLRLDVADELPDFFLETLVKCAKHCKKDAFVMGEIWENAIRKFEGKRNYLLGASLHSVMNYPFTDAIIKCTRFKDTTTFKYVTREIYQEYPREAMLSAMNALGTHDIPRPITSLVGNGIIQNSSYEWVWDIGPYGRDWQYKQLQRFSRADYKKAKQMLKAALVLLYFLPGNPCVYYGDEVGLFGYKDPWNRGTYPWGHRDKKLLKFYRKIGNTHNQFPLLAKAGYKFISDSNDVVVYERRWKKAIYRVVVNFSDTTQAIPIPDNFKFRHVIFTTQSQNTQTKKQLHPFEAIVVANC